LETSKINLTELFYGKFVPPVNHVSRVHKIGLSGGHRYIPPKKIPVEIDTRPPEERLSKSVKEIWKLLKFQKKPISALEMASKTGWTGNHCNIVLCKLFKLGIATRQKRTKPGTRYYVYEAKK